MQVTLMKGKIHRASVTEADLHYESAISIDGALLDAAGFLVHERVEIFNTDRGARFATYVFEAPRGSGTIDVNGAAARLALPGDRIIVDAYASLEEAEAKTFRPRVVVVDRQNRILPVEGREAGARANASSAPEFCRT
ncbi:aspartate 1-decarboxylase [Bradyrhizobium sp. 49]|uniref:aspartate 1-decarboxylase n=1 Tax=unclassified Bradyrhizobium TaxID=2631580 RepID=UPI001FF816CD|nr:MULTISPECIES: aspartate 1-decarboxylase [unclassified Bradyrhizobium]MCK1272920.1 aspartate 1-decarboxylase [Bradyrhizobium sp. 84]MCK1371658.1 aspartate 1-decarboxylase [Bradyrhizobium sp. 49]